MLECVVNLSEGRSADALSRLTGAAGAALLDVHVDPHHHRCVLTLAGPAVEQSARSVTTEALRVLNLATHSGVHPRLGVVDVVPFVPLGGSTMADAVAARDRFARWVGDALRLPCFVYGPDVSPSATSGTAAETAGAGRTLPDIRRLAFTSLAPDHGPPVPHATAGAVCAGARPVLVAYNLWLDADMDVARSAARAVRGERVRALGFDVGGRAQVSLNLIDPQRFGPADAYDAVARLAPVAGAELVGLIPAAVLDSVPAARWTDLDLSPERTIEARTALAAKHW